jgi:ATPase subunit of ABC transporter with duplicated ATPase domains
MDPYTGGSSAQQYNTNKALEGYTAASTASILTGQPGEKSILPKIIPLKKKKQKKKEEEERIEKSKKAASAQAEKQQLPVKPKHEKKIIAPKGDEERFNASKLEVENESMSGPNTRLLRSVSLYLTRGEKYITPHLKKKGRINVRL